MASRQRLLIVADGFDEFWGEWPKKVAKKEAQKAWNEIGPDAALRARIKAAVAWQRNQPGWLKDGGQYVPNAATWLRAERWDDEPFHTPQVSEKTMRTLQGIYGD